MFSIAFNIVTKIPVYNSYSKGIFFLSNRTTTMPNLTNSTDTTIHSESREISKHESAEWKWKVTLTGLTAILSITVCIFSFKIRSKYLLIHIQS